MPRSRARLPGRLFLAVMLTGAALITASSLVYFDFGALPPFVVERMPQRFASVWLVSLRVHVAAALVSFPLCLVLTTRWLQRRPLWHRWLGRTSGVLVLAALVPSGAVLALHAKGGALVSAGFLVSAGLVAWFMVRGVGAARRRDLVEHARAMRHVVGQMSVAVTSRAMLVGMDGAGVDPDVAYVVALWVPVLASVAVAEILSARPAVDRPLLARFIERIRRDFAPKDLLVRVRAPARSVARSSR